MNQIPEELEAMAFLIGQSNQIDAMMVNKPSSLITSTDTLKKGLNEYVQQQRNKMIQPTPILEHVQNPNFVEQQNIINNPIQPKNDDGQLEFNLEPTKIDEIIFLLKEISIKLTKQHSMLEKYNAHQFKKEGTTVPIVKLGSNK
jgi:hypothetical protein